MFAISKKWALACLLLFAPLLWAVTPEQYCAFAVEGVDPHWKAAMTRNLEALEHEWDQLARSHGGEVPIRSREEAERAVLVRAYQEFRRLAQELHDNEMLARQEGEFRELADQRNAEIRALLPGIAQDLRARMLAELDPPPSKKFLLEIRADGSGLDGEVFVGMLRDMYVGAAAASGGKVKIEILHQEAGESGKGYQGMKEVVIAVEGPEAYEFVRHEVGKHQWKAKGLIKPQTFSTPISVLALPEPAPAQFSLKPTDYTITTTSSQGPGGQNVNKTESKVVITHKTLPIKVEMQDERSQHRNREKALRIFTARVAAYMQTRATAAANAQRREQLSGNVVRTYRNVDPVTVKDERTGEKQKYDEVLSGEALGNFRDELDVYRLEQLLLEQSD